MHLSSSEKRETSDLTLEERREAQRLAELFGYDSDDDTPEPGLPHPKTLELIAVEHGLGNRHERAVLRLLRRKAFLFSKG